MSETYLDDRHARERSSMVGFPPEAHAHRRIWWGAVIGGVVMVVAFQIMLSLLGAGIGLGTVNTNAGTTPDVSSLGMGAGLWWMVSSMLALFGGGYIASRLAGNVGRFDGILHGLITWGISTVLTVYLLTSTIGGLIGGGFSAMGSIASSASGGIKDAAAPIAKSVGISPDMIQQQAQAYLQPSDPNPATMSSPDAQKAIARDLFTYAQRGPESEAAKGRIIDITAAQMKISRGEAARKFDDAQAKADATMAAAKQKAADAADATASGASKTSFAVFVDLLLGAIAAALGGALAIRRDEIGHGKADPARRITA